MKAQRIMQIFSRNGGVIGSDTVKKCFYILIVISVLGTLGLTSVSKKAQQKSWLFTSTSLHYSNSLDIKNSIKLGYFLFDNDKDDDPVVKHAQLFSNLVAVAIGLFLIVPFINSHWKFLFDEIKSFLNISFFSPLSLRSPPSFF
jgi:hypothetical protein